MKNFILIIIFLLNFTLSFAQTIDNLDTNKKVAQFLKKEINNEYTFKEVFDKEKEEDEEDFEYFVKRIDLDNNGYTDLIVDAYVPLIIILNNGNKEYKELKFNNPHFYSDNQPRLDFIAEIGNEKVLIFETEIQKYDNTDAKFKIDSLTVKFGELVTYKKSKPGDDKIKELHFSTSGCFGRCPVFEIKLTSDRNFTYNGKRFTNHIGLKKLKLNPSDYNNLIGLLEYADLKELEDNYSVNWTDDQTGRLKVIYENGDTKEIQDYGLRGTINLRAIYKILFQINDRIK